MKKTILLPLALFTILIGCKNNETENKVQPVTIKNEIKKPKQEPKQEPKPVSEECKDIEVEMGSGRECLLKNTDFETAYKNIIKNKEVEESEYYLSELPKGNKSVEVNKNGLISIDYVISENKIEISMGYEGGNTEVTLEKIDQNVKRSIYHYAD